MVTGAKNLKVTIDHLSDHLYRFHIPSLTKGDNVTVKHQLPFLLNGDNVTIKPESERPTPLHLRKIIASITVSFFGNVIKRWMEILFLVIVESRTQFIEIDEWLIL